MYLVFILYLLVCSLIVRPKHVFCWLNLTSRLCTVTGKNKRKVIAFLFYFSFLFSIWQVLLVIGVTLLSRLECLLSLDWTPSKSHLWQKSTIFIWHLMGNYWFLFFSWIYLLTPACYIHYIKSDYFATLKASDRFLYSSIILSY